MQLENDVEIQSQKILQREGFAPPLCNHNSHLLSAYCVPGADLGDFYTLSHYLPTTPL